MQVFLSFVLSGEHMRTQGGQFLFVMLFLSLTEKNCPSVLCYTLYVWLLISLHSKTSAPYSDYSLKA